MKRLAIGAAFALAVAVAMPGTASAFGHGGHGGGGFHGGGFHGGGFHGGGWHGGGWRGGGWGWRGGGWYGGYGYPAYYGAYGCWRWVAFPYWHRVWACY
jgi:hypothetical protein